MHYTRRRFLGVSAGAVAAGLAGCAADPSDDGTGTDGRAQASFYLLFDFARHVGGDDLAVESVVPFGQHGHGWDGPTAGQLRDVLSADLFIYVGDGFQPWADDVVDTIHDDDADVEVVSARAGVELIGFRHEERGDAGDDEDGRDDHDGDDHDADDRDGDGHEADGHDGDENDDAHGHGEHDPHFWLDPRRAAQAVENVRDGMVAVDPDNEDAHRERADGYVGELSALHEEFESALANAEKDAVLVAGHDAFGYLGETYGFEIHALTGLAPDEGISASARRRAQAVVDEHDIEYVLWPALEPRSPAEGIVAETGATDVLEITAISGVTDEWIAKDLGYMELMRTINLPSFRRALGGA